MTNKIPTAVPDELKKINNWLVWRLEHMPDEPKPRKVPYYASGAKRYGVQGDDADRTRLCSFDRAALACNAGDYSGLGLAILPDCGVVALDFDDCVQNGEVDPGVLSVIDGTYAEFSPSGAGVRAFMRGHLPSRKDTAHPSLKVEFFGTSGFVTVTGNVLPYCDLMGHTEIVDLTPAALALFEQRFGMPQVSDAAGLGALAAIEPKRGLSLQDAQALLRWLDPDCSRGEWLSVGMGLHHEFDGSVEALDLFDDWSSSGAKYAGRKDVEGRWNSFGRNFTGKQVTAGTLLAMAGEAKARHSYNVRDGWAKQIREAADEFSLREKLCPMIAKDETLGELDREALAQVLLEAFKSLGTKYPIAQCRTLLAEKRTRNPGAPSDLPAWAQQWVYVTDDDKFFRMDSDEWLSMQGFNARFNRMVPSDDDGFRKAASWVALEDLQIPSVTRAMYLPWGDAMFEMDGVKIVNTYRPSSVPVAAASITPSGQGAIALVIRHLRALCGGREDLVETLLAWFAHNVQRPGVKIRWAPLVKGVEGDGKTILGKLLAAVMGMRNVNNISPKVLGTDFTGWAEGHAIGVLEEVRIVGHSRHDIFNALKPYITNDSVPVHRKGKDEYNIVNVTNYLGFTNFGDALPLTDNDRRWLIIFTPFASRAEMEASLGLGEGGLNAYFDQLHAAIDAHRSELRTWLLTYTVPAWFKPNGSAPDTEEKRRMIAMGVSPEEEAIADAIAAGLEGVTDTVLSSSCLSAALLGRVELNLNTTALNRALTKAGWTKVAKKLKWRGKAHHIWTRGAISCEPANLRNLLDSTPGSESAASMFGLERNLEQP